MLNSVSSKEIDILNQKIDKLSKLILNSTLTKKTKKEMFDNLNNQKQEYIKKIKTLDDEILRQKEKIKKGENKISEINTYFKNKKKIRKSFWISILFSLCTILSAISALLTGKYTIILLILTLLFNTLASHNSFEYYLEKKKLKEYKKNNFNNIKDDEINLYKLDLKFNNTQSYYKIEELLREKKDSLKDDYSSQPLHVINNINKLNDLYIDYINQKVEYNDIHFENQKILKRNK